MNQPKSIIPIRPIDFDMAKRTVDAFAAERNVPTQVYPQEVVPEAGDEGKGRAEPIIPPARSPVRKFTVELPDYVIDAVLTRALQSKPRTTSRYVVLEALRSIGIDVKDEDMVLDGRRTTPGHL